MKHVINLWLFLFVFWLGMSAHYGALLLALGVISTAFIVYLVIRADLIDYESYPLHLSPSLLLRFWLHKSL